MVIISLKDRFYLRVLIAENGYTLSQFADEINMSHSYLSQLLAGKYRPSPNTAYKIATHFNLKINDIFVVEVKE